jgi:hypothetical protein
MALSRDTLQHFCTDYHQWFDDFKQFYSAEDEGSCNLLMLYHVAVVVVYTAGLEQLTSFEHYTEHFREIVRLATIYNSHKSQQDTFTLELGSIAPLYFVATKCRVPSLRRQALRLMKFGPRKESVFGAKSVAEVAGRLIAIEEESLGLPVPWLDEQGLSVDDTVLPPEENRVHSYQILINSAARRFELRTTRFFWNTDGRRQKLVQDFPV